MIFITNPAYTFHKVVKEMISSNRTPNTPRAGAILIAVALSCACSKPESTTQTEDDLGVQSGEDAGSDLSLAADLGPSEDQPRDDLGDTITEDMDALPEDMSSALERELLLYERMIQGARMPSTAPLSTDAFDTRDNDTRSPDPLDARLTLSPAQSRWRPIRDDYNATLDQRLRDLPTFEVEVASRPEDGLLLPRQRGLRVLDSDNSWWAMVGAGKTWRERGDRGYSRAALPFTLVQPHANCSFHGTLTFLYDSAQDTGDPSRALNITDAYYQITQETCLYLKLDMWGWLTVEASAASGEEQDRAPLLAAHDAQVMARPEVLPLEDLRALGLEPQRLGESLTQAHITLQGVYWEGKHYHSGCQTREGELPFCDEITLPSYSTAKSAVAGLAYFALAKEGTLDQDLTLGSQVEGVPRSWQEVTLGELLSMTSGHYDSTAYMADEDGIRMADFFLAIEDQAKTDAALAFPAQQGKPWVYHSSDTYLAFRLMQSWLGQDLYAWLVEHVFAPLRLSDAARDGLRTIGGTSQHFGSHGSWWLPSDIVLLARMLQDHASGARDDLLDATRVQRALQRTPEAQGVLAGEGLYYHRGFWALEVTRAQGFPCDRRIPFMSGFGGITVVLLPNDAIYYVFSDNAEFAWLSAARELSKLGDFCSN